jgi:hypothetical protein
MRFGGVAVCVLGVFVASKQACAATYTLAPVAYTAKNGVYVAATNVTGSFTTAAPLPANLTDVRIANGTGGLGYVTSWSFNDGVFVYTDANSGPLSGSGGNFRVTTDGTGAIVGLSINLVSPLLFSTPGQTMYRLDMFSAAGNPSTSVIAGIYVCPSGTVGVPCGTFFADPGNDHGLAATAPVFTLSGAPPAPAPALVSAPSLSRWALFALVAALAILTGLAARVISKRD